MSTFWAVVDGEVVGVAKLRHSLTEALLQEGGHIGFYIRPTARRRGYATRTLKLTLDEAKVMHLDRVLLTCDSDNLGSRRVIESNGGVLENEPTSAVSGKPIRRYWWTS